jgi:competence protein ComEA
VQRIVIAGIVAAIAALAIWHPAPRPPQVLDSPSATAPPHKARAATGRPAQFVIYVAGEVARPGLYRVRAGARTDEAVRLAGGLLKSADPLAVNLAAKLNDGDEVAVAAVGASHPSSRGNRRTARRPKVAAKSLEPQNVNTADVQALAHVPGIGPAIARRIVEMREQDGPFSTLDELLDVAGMTPSRLSRASQYLIL